MWVKNTFSLPFFLLIVLACSCSNEQEPNQQTAHKPARTPSATNPLFTSVAGDHSNIDFTNRVEENPEQNYYKYEYLYNGGGVALGDLNNDGLPDIVFTGNLVRDRVYLNKGNLVFEDVSQSAFESGHGGWHSGVTMADVNGDGFVDIYICRAGWYTDPQMRANLLYINNGDMTFTERAKAFGIADTSRSTHSAFLDYDRDGDLDLFVVNSPIQGTTELSNLAVNKLIANRESTTDRLFRNDGDSFTDVTAEKDLWNMGYGLGLSVSDLDKNGYPDIYVANDYIERDQYYVNRHGRFEEEALKRFRHISNFGMGCDAADINNDGFADLMVLDMASEDHVRSKRNMGAMNRDKFWLANKAGYHLQYMFNTLQLNNGNGSFSEIANMAGIAKTDWSWAPLFADFDNDGLKDLIITNGFKRDMRDNDYMNSRDQLLEKNNGQVDFDEMLALVPTSKIRNYLYRNNGDLTFEDVSESWGFAKNVNSNGAAYADLDRDGDLDVVINNMDVVSEIFENHTNEQRENNFIQIAFEDAYNAKAQGAKVTLNTAAGIQYAELISSRGYQSSVEPFLHFGLGKLDKVKSIEIEWPDRVPGMTKTIVNPKLNTLHRIRTEKEGLRMTAPKLELFAEKKLAIQHKENEYDDFDVEVLLPHKLSELGPHLSSADVNGDGHEDVFVGGARGSSGTLLFGNGMGGFKPAPNQTWKMHKESEDLGSAFFDADGDGDQDLYVVSGSNEISMHFDQYNDRLYLNDGRGNFKYSVTALPNMQTSAQRIAVGDIDGDGDKDLFVGGRGIPGQYPKAPRSYLLLNDGSGQFKDATADLAVELVNAGLVTDALFTDHDNDGDLDLFVVGEWMPLQLFDNTEFGFVKKEMPEFANSTGWWQSITAYDVDGDGDEDIVAGNIGLNNKFHPSVTKPLHVYWNDFDGNQRNDIVLAKADDKKLLPVRGKECSTEQCPMVSSKFPSYKGFANASLEEIYGSEGIRNGLHYQAVDFASYILINDGNGHYQKSSLPSMAQIAPIMGSDFADVNADGHLDLIVAGNLWGAEIETVRYDAGNGLVMLGNGKNDFEPIPAYESGLFADGNVKDLIVIQSDTQLLIVVANNNGPLQLFKNNGPQIMSYLPE